MTLPRSAGQSQFCQHVGPLESGRADMAQVRVQPLTVVPEFEIPEGRVRRHQLVRPEYSAGALGVSRAQRDRNGSETLVQHRVVLIRSAATPCPLPEHLPVRPGPTALPGKASLSLWLVNTSWPCCAKGSPTTRRDRTATLKRANARHVLRARLAPVRQEDRQGPCNSIHSTKL